jgi:hypothetical protein
VDNKEAVAEYLFATTIPEALQVLAAHPDLVKDPLAERLIEHFGQTSDDAQFAATCRERLAFLRRVREAGIESAYKERQDLEESLHAIWSIRQFADLKDVLYTRPVLLTGTADDLLARVEATQPTEATRNTARKLRELVRACRIEGIDQAFARQERDNRIAEIAGKLAGKEFDPRTQFAERALLCREGLALVDRARDPLPWATLSLGLADSLVHEIVSGVMDREAQANEAIRLIQEVLESGVGGVSPRTLASAKYSLAVAYLYRGGPGRARDLERSIALHTEALNAFEEFDDWEQWVTVANSLAMTYRVRGTGDRAENLERALELYRDALAVATPETMGKAWARIKSNMANVYIDRIVGDPASNIEEALGLAAEALSVRTRESDPRAWAQTTMTRGNCFRRRQVGDPAQNMEQAIACHTSIVDFLDPKYAEDRLRALHNLADAYQERIHGSREENLEKALHYASQAMEGQDRESVPFDWAMAAANLAQIFEQRLKGSREDNIAAAIVWYRKALQVFTAEQQPSENRMVNSALGHLYFRERKWKEAISCYRSGLAAQEGLYQTAAMPEARASHLHEIRLVAPRLAYCLAKTDAQEEAVVTLELGRGRTLAENVALYDATIENLSAEDQAALEALRSTIRALQNQAMLPAEAPERRDFVTISEEFNRANTELRETVERIRKDHSGFLSPPVFADIRRAAVSRVLVYLLAGLDDGIAFVLRGVGSQPIETIWLPGLTEAGSFARIDGYWGKYRKHLNAPDDADARRSWLAALDSTANWLWNAGMGNLARALGSEERVAIIPIGLTGFLPLHAAWTEDPAQPSGRLYAIDILNIAYAPSARLLEVSHTRSANHPQVDSFFAVDEPRPVNALPLPNAAGEVAFASSHFSKKVILRHEKATRENALGRMAEFSVLHFACHGRANAFEPLDSGLTLSNNTLLSLRDLLNLRLPGTRLAVLSACESGVAGAQAPDELVGLPGGLLQAGVAGVVGSLWSVADASTMLLMAQFYHEWQKNWMDPVQALRLAQQWVRDATNREKRDFIRSIKDLGFGDDLYLQLSLSDPDERQHTHPFHWAAFSFYGL